jgi:hypothetical protein
VPQEGRGGGNLATSSTGRRAGVPSALRRAGETKTSFQRGYSGRRLSEAGAKLPCRLGDSQRRRTSKYSIRRLRVGDGSSDNGMPVVAPPRGVSGVSIAVQCFGRASKAEN